MNFEYRKIFHRNYLIITDYNISDYTECYRSKMLKSNALEQFLPYDTRNINGHIEFTYDISSRQSLYSFYENSTIDYEMLRHIMMSLRTAFDALNNYLLEPDFMVLNPNCIYINPGTKSLYFCFCPGEKNNFYDSLSEFLNFLLGKINHADQNSIVLAYSLQQCSLNPNYTIHDLMEVLETPAFHHEAKPQEETSFSFEEPEHSYQEPEPLPSLSAQVPLLQKTTTDSFSPRRLIPAIFLSALFFAAGYFYFQLQGILLLCLGFSPVLCVLCLSFFTERKEELPVPDSLSFSSDDFSEKIPENNFLFSDEDVQTESNYYEDTIILGYRNTDNLPKLIYTGTDFTSESTLDSFPFLIGKMSEKVQLTIDNPMISRIHARIHLKENTYYLEDMNSSNGTYLNNELIQPHSLAELKPGDFITFSHLTYLFQ